MNIKGDKWFEDSVRSGMNKMAAHHGREIINSWANYWNFIIPDEVLTKMIRFGLAHPIAAIHRWSLQSGPCPWVPQDAEEKMLKKDPRYSPFDLPEFDNK